VEHLTGNGTIRIGRVVYWSRGQGTHGGLDRWLGIADRRVSVAARELCCRSTVDGLGFRRASENLSRLGQITVSSERLREIVEAEGQAVLVARHSGALGPEWTAADCAVAPQGPRRVMLGSDGVLVPLVSAEEKRRRRQRRRRGRKASRSGRGRGRRGRWSRGSPVAWKEFKIGCFYDQERLHTYAFGTSGDSDALGRLWRREAAKVDLNAADQRVAIADGAEWIDTQLRSRLPMVETRILDYFHLMEHVGAAAKVCFGEGTAAGAAWRERLATAVCEEGGAALLSAVEAERKTVRSKAKRESLRQLSGYVGKRLSQLDYPAFRAAGYDLGSGPTEALCKTLTSRLKGRGRRWDRPNADALMALAAVEHSGLWASYWQLQLRAA
jgi:hypothetical protein